MSQSATIAVDMNAVISVLGDMEQWRHNCHAASRLLTRSGVLGDSRLARGTTMGVNGQHSWVVIGADCYDEHATVVDPTLWSYDPSVEGVWVGQASERAYRPDGYGSIWRTPTPPDMTEGRPQPARTQLVDKVRAILDIDPTGEPIYIPGNGLSPDAVRFLAWLGPQDLDGWARWFSRVPVGGWPAAEIIRAAYEHDDLRAFIPVDRLEMLTGLDVD